MRNVGKWQPSKYVRRDGRLRATTDIAQLGAGSRLIAGLVAEAYDRALKVHATGRLLDMGCGKAPLYEAYRDFVSDVQCIDWGNSLHGSEYLDKTCDLSGTLPYPDGSFDTIILSDVLEHLPEPMNCWREMGRLLAPGGKVILNVPFHYQLHEVPHDYYRYTEFALCRFAERSGFDVIELEPVGGPVEIIADIAAKVLATKGYARSAVTAQNLARRFSATRAGTRVSHKFSRRFPLGYFMVTQKV